MEYSNSNIQVAGEDFTGIIDLHDGWWVAFKTSDPLRVLRIVMAD